MLRSVAFIAASFTTMRAKGPRKGASSFSTLRSVSTGKDDDPVDFGEAAGCDFGADGFERDFLDSVLIDDRNADTAVSFETKFLGDSPIASTYAAEISSQNFCALEGRSLLFLAKDF